MGLGIALKGKLWEKGSGHTILGRIRRAKGTL
jgi:hypothetical protein